MKYPVFLTASLICQEIEIGKYRIPENLSTSFGFCLVALIEKIEHLNNTCRQGGEWSWQNEIGAGPASQKRNWAERFEAGTGDFIICQEIFGLVFFYICKRKSIKFNWWSQSYEKANLKI